jgi:hypothetical protein
MSGIDTLTRRLERLREHLQAARGLPPVLWIKEDGTEEIALPGDERWPRALWKCYGEFPNDDGIEP